MAALAIGPAETEGYPAIGPAYFAVSTFAAGPDTSQPGGRVWLVRHGLLFLLAAFHEPQAFYKLIPFVFLTMVGAAIPTPGMVGGFHYFSKEALLRLYFPLKHPGTAPDVIRAMYTTKAVSMTLVIHAMQVIMTWLVGFVIILREGLSFSKLRQMSGEMRP